MPALRPVEEVGEGNMADAGIEKPMTDETGNPDFEGDALSELKSEFHDFFSGAGFAGETVAAVAVEDEDAETDDSRGTGANEVEEEGAETVGAEVEGRDIVPEGVGVGAEETTGGIEGAGTGTETDGTGADTSTVGAASTADNSETTDSALVTTGKAAFVGFSIVGEETA